MTKLISSPKKELHIDTRDTYEIKVKLVIENKTLEMKHHSSHPQSQFLLDLIEKIMKENSIKFTELTGIHVFAGLGSYTGLRVGIAVANTLSWLYDIPVNGKKKSLVLPKYK